MAVGIREKFYVSRQGNPNKSPKKKRACTEAIRLLSAAADSSGLAPGWYRESALMQCMFKCAAVSLDVGLCPLTLLLMTTACLLLFLHLLQPAPLAPPHSSGPNFDI